jgi:hypothetical protein
MHGTENIKQTSILSQTLEVNRRILRHKNNMATEKCWMENQDLL